MGKAIEGFSKFTKAEKIDWLVRHHFTDHEKAIALLEKYKNTDEVLQKLHDEFAENTIGNYYLPFCVAPNFLINNKMYTLPMVTEESSVVAAACKSAKFWMSRGGFKARVISTIKNGQIHFIYRGSGEKLRTFFYHERSRLIKAMRPFTKNMRKRGGGLLDIALRDRTYELKDYYQLHCTFETSEAMGANFINSCLEELREIFKREMKRSKAFDPGDPEPDIIMSILSNFTPDCLVRAEVSCEVEALNEYPDIPPREFAEKFIRATDVAVVETYRSVTHNKGIMNGVDAVTIATGNDFRAVEAAAHAYACKIAHYTSLTRAIIKDNQFKLWLDIPLSLGTVGGLTQLHPMAKLAMGILGNPNAKELMEIVAVAGLAQNFAAVSALITTGIQKGHMKMHLLNILNHCNANDKEKQTIIAYFKDKKVTHDAVIKRLKKLRKPSIF